MPHDTLDGDDFFTSNSVYDHWRYTNTEFETRNESSFAEIGQKLTYVDQKVLSIMISLCSDKDLFISLLFFYNRYMNILQDRYIRVISQTSECGSRILLRVKKS